jgi:flagellar hook-associated protein 3 FlgL
MSLLPVITPRTSEPLQQQRSLFQINSDQAQLQKLFDQLSTGRRVISGSDDPAATARAINLKSGIAHADQMVRNASVASGYLANTDSALSQIDQALIEARGVAITAAQTVIGPDERSALTAELDQVIRRVLMSGNDSFGDTALFGGALADKAPLEYRGNGILFTGNEAMAKPAIAKSTLVESLATGVGALGLAMPVVKGESLDSAMNRDTRLVDLRDGRGVVPGVMRLKSGSGSVEVDLRGAVTVGDLVDRIESVQLGGRALSVDVASDSLTFRYADNLNGTLGIEDAPGWSTAKQLNISNPQSLIAPPITGAGLTPRTTLNTRLSELNGGAGLDVSAGIRIGVNDDVYTVDLSQAETIDAVVTAINRSGAPLRAELDPTTEAIQIRFLESGANYSIGENGGLAATRLGIRTSDGTTTLNELHGGRGVQLNPDSDPDITFTRPDGTVLAIDASGFETVQEVIDAINNHPQNQDTRRITASLTSVGNGIELRGPVDTRPIRVTQAATSNLGNVLGLIPQDNDSSEGSVVGGFSVLTGTDYRTREPEGTLDTLLRMRDAVASGDTFEIERLSERLNVDLDRSSGARGELGFRSQTIDELKNRAEDQSASMTARLSDEIDADFTETISNINQRQAAIEASLRVIGQASGLTVLNFL